MASEKILTLTDQNFESEVLKSDKPVLVDFTATWCGPCKMLSPIVDKLADNFAEYKVAKLDIDEAPGIAQKYGVRAVPTVMVFQGGQKKSQHVGLTNQEGLLKLLQGGGLGL